MFLYYTSYINFGWFSLTLILILWHLLIRILSVFYLIMQKTPIYFQLILLSLDLLIMKTENVYLKIKCYGLQLWKWVQISLNYKKNIRKRFKSITSVTKTTQSWDYSLHMYSKHHSIWVWGWITSASAFQFR